MLILLRSLQSAGHVVLGTLGMGAILFEDFIGMLPVMGYGLLLVGIGPPAAEGPQPS